MMTKTKYHLFAGQIYYAKGGANDFVASAWSVEDLLDVFQKLQKSNDWRWEWYHIVDGEMNVVEQSTKLPHGAL